MTPTPLSYMEFSRLVGAGPDSPLRIMTRLIREGRVEPEKASVWMRCWLDEQRASA